MADTNFTEIDLQEFLGSTENIDTQIVVLTSKEHDMVWDLQQKLTITAPQKMQIFNKRMASLKKLAAAMAEFPSLLEHTVLTAGERTPQTIIEDLLNSAGECDSLLSLPSKATLGRGFLVAKIHTFSSLTKLAVDANFEKNLIQAFYDETAAMTFLLLAEDVYLDIVRDESLPIEVRRQLANSLLLLWEHRADQNIADIAPMLQSIWNARRTLAPAFGTMLGTSELLTISIQMDEIWATFIKTQLSNPEVSHSLEEFLFGISYEQILKLRSILCEKGISAIGRDEVSHFLGIPVKTNLNYEHKDFFAQYALRRDNARARKRLNIEGPHKTIEDIFVLYIIEKNREKQSNDILKYV